jgi:hypothetical protein
LYADPAARFNQPRFWCWVVRRVVAQLHVRESLDISGELLQRLVLGHRSGSEHLLFLPPQAVARWVRYPEMKESNPTFPLSRSILFTQPSGLWVRRRRRPRSWKSRARLGAASFASSGRCPGSGLVPRSRMTALYTPSIHRANAKWVG